MASREGNGGGGGAAVGPLAGARFRPRARAPPSSGLAAVRKPACLAAARLLFHSVTVQTPTNQRLWRRSRTATAGGSPGGETLVSLRRLYSLARVTVCNLFRSKIDCLFV